MTPDTLNRTLQHRDFIKHLIIRVAFEMRLEN